MERDAIDLGSLSVLRLFRKYFIPTLLGMLGMSAVTAIDGIFVGQGVGSDGIAAVNIVVPVYMVYTGVGLMLDVGCSVVASIHLSRGRTKVARLNITQSLLFATAVAVVPSLVMMIFPQSTVTVLGASGLLVPLAKEYLLWFVPSWVFQVWISIALFIIRLDGAPRFAMACSLVSAFLNVVLDWIFIFPLGWGLKGAAFATSISLAVGGIMAVVYLFLFARHLKVIPLKLSRKSMLLSLRNVGYQCRIGSSSLLAEATMAILMFMGNRVFMEYLGEDGVGAFGIACYYMPFVFMIGNAIAQSAQPIISYNFGLGHRERVAKAEKIALGTSVLCALVVTAAFVLCPQALVGVFVDGSTDAARIACEGFPLFSAAFVFFILNLTVIGYFQSIKKTLPATLLALCRGLLFLVPSFILLPRIMGTEGIWLALGVSEMATIIVAAAISMKHPFV